MEISLKMVLKVMVLLFSIVSIDLAIVAQGIERAQETANPHGTGNTQGTGNVQRIGTTSGFLCCPKKNVLCCPPSNYNV